MREPDANGVRLPNGFTSRIVARTGLPPSPNSAYEWHAAPDGGATFRTGGDGWIYVSNSEVPHGGGGVGALRFDGRGRLIDAYSILEGTSGNCAGGPTPWGTWLSCEEIEGGKVWECDPLGRRSAIARPALGVFVHEAVAVDPIRSHLYLTEDRYDGRLYRFTSDTFPDLSSGILEVAEICGGNIGTVRWHRVPDPVAISQPTRLQVPESTAFRGGEGIWYHEDVVYFTTSDDNRVWAYDAARHQVEVIYDDDRFEVPPLTGVDNVMVSAEGDILVAEDGGDMQIVVITANRSVVPILQVVGHKNSEVTGPALDPSGRRLYFSSQRGEAGDPKGGVTFEVTGPFLHSPVAALVHE